MPDPKPVAEVFAAIYMNAVHRVNRERTPWLEASDDLQAEVMHGMSEVIGFLEMFEIGVKQEGSEVRLVRLERKPMRKTTATSLHPSVEALRMAKEQGFEGDACDQCGMMMMVRNGSCLKCTSCGATTGCS